jgi:hypothetical protein
MTKLPRAIVALAPLAALLVACAPVASDTGSASPSPTPSLDATAPAPSAGALPAGEEITAWAAIALPADRPGGESPVMSAAGPITLDRPASLDISQNQGLWDLLLTCQSADGSPVQWQIDSPTSSIAGPTEQQCTSPTGGTPSTAIIGFEGPESTLRLTSSDDAVYAVQVRPHDDGQR